MRKESSLSKVSKSESSLIEGRLVNVNKIDDNVYQIESEIIKKRRDEIIKNIIKESKAFNW
jgi:hypothetical protein